MNETRTNPTTTAAQVYRLEADNRAAHHSRRTQAAQARHQVNTAGTWTATPEGIRPPIHRQSGAQLLKTADTATFLALRARHASSGLDLFAQLTNEAHADQMHRNIETTAAKALEAERAHAQAQAAYTYHTAQAERKTITPAEAKAHRAQAKKAKKAAEDTAKEAKALNDIIKAATASDREPLVQAATAAALAYIQEHAADLDPAAIFPVMCAAAGREIANIAAPDAGQSTRTKVQEISPEKAAELRQAYPDIVITDPRTGDEITAPCRIPHNVKGATSQCFDTVELRERGRKPNRRKVWCLVSHYLTIAPYISYEAFVDASGGEVAELATNGGLNAIGTQEDAAAIADLIHRANLSEREAEIMSKAADQTAARHGQHAAAEYWKKRTPEIATLKTPKARREAFEDAKATADRERIAAQWGNAFDRQGVRSDRTRRDIKARIYTKLTEAQTPAEPLSQEEQTEREAKAWERMQRSTRRGNTARESTRPDFVGRVCPAAILAASVLDWKPIQGWTYRPAKSAADSAAIMTNPAPVITWTDSQTAPEAITPGQDYRAAEVEARAATKGGQASPPALTERERRQREKLVQREQELFALWRMFDRMSGNNTDKAAKLPEADTQSQEARAEAERMRRAAAKLAKVNTR